MIWAALVAGIAVGVLSGLVGIGGGILLIPIFVYGFKMDQHTAQGTSLAALLAPIGIFAFLQYYQAGHVNVKVAIFIALGFLLGGYFGGHWAQQISGLWLRRAFSILLVITAAKMFFEK